MNSKVLIAEDDVVNGRLLKGMLDGQHYDVELVESGAQALNAFDRADFDLLVTDLHMPGMDGIELIEALQARGKNPPVIVLTAEHDVSIAVRAMKLGIYDYVLKPVHQEEFILRSRHAVDMGRLRRAAQIADKERELRLERQVAWSVWKEDVVGRDRDRFNKTLFDNLRMSFNQGIGFGGLVTLASLIADTSEKVDGAYRVDAELMDLLMDNARMAEKAMRRFEDIDTLVREDIATEEMTVRELRGLISEVADGTSSLLTIKNQTIVIGDPPREAGSVRIARDLFADAVRELLINAMKFSVPSTQILVLFRLAGDSLYISFINSPAENQFGTRGIPEEYTRLVFEPFFRAVRTVDERYGTLDYGLGLPVVEKVVQKHGGRIMAGSLRDFLSPSATGELVANFELQLPVVRG